MPPNIESYILNKCKEGNCIVKIVKNNQIIGNLSFNAEGMSKTTESQFSIVGYLNRIVKYAKGDLRIYVNDLLLDELPVLLADNSMRNNK